MGESWREVVLGREEVPKAREDLRNVDSLDAELNDERSSDERRVFPTDGEKSFSTGGCERSVWIVNEIRELSAESSDKEGGEDGRLGDRVLGC